jgi:copper resistance protein C
MSRAVLTALLLVLLVPGVARAHAVLVKSSPAKRAVVSTPPPRVELVFNERLEPAYSTVSVWAADNRRIDDGKVVVGPEDPRRLTVGVPPVQAGTYTIKFRVLSVDGHIVEGTFPFEVRPRP